MNLVNHAINNKKAKYVQVEKMMLFFGLWFWTPRICGKDKSHSLKL